MLIFADDNNATIDSVLAAIKTQTIHGKVFKTATGIHYKPDALGNQFKEWGFWTGFCYGVAYSLDGSREPQQAYQPSLSVSEQLAIPPASTML